MSRLTHTDVILMEDRRWQVEEEEVEERRKRRRRKSRRRRRREEEEVRHQGDIRGGRNRRLIIHSELLPYRRV